MDPPPPPPPLLPPAPMRAAKAAALVGKALVLLAWLAAFAYAGKQAYSIRLYAIKTYGRIIHEFDPWFNFRATKYLAENGLQRFFTWFDYESWYPLGRPVGTTIYPGMQMTSVAIWEALKHTMKKPLSLNDVCCFVPAWFGVSASIFLGLLTTECSRSHAAGAAGALIMSTVPAHLMRSVGGGYDNESIALTAMCATFFCWVRALRADPAVTDGRATKGSYVFGALCGVCYIYMVAAWGGFVFVLNMIGAHAAMLILLGRYTSKLHRAYSLFFIIGTSGAMRVPVVGWSPLRSLEQLAPLLAFVGIQGLEYCEVMRRKRKLTMMQHQLLRLKVALVIGLAVGAVAAYLYPTGYFGPLSARVRGLFVKHTRTGNPLVDSVAEHQPANAQAYQQYLHHIYYIAPVGLALSLLTWTDSNSFLVLYAIVAYYFSNRMARLVILLGPVASALGGVAVGWAVDQLLLYPAGRLFLSLAFGSPTADTDYDIVAAPARTRQKGKDADEAIAKLEIIASNMKKKLFGLYSMRAVLVLRIALGVMAVQWILPHYKEFDKYSHQIAESLSQPSIMFKARLQNGREIMVDDYREAYWWLRDQTPSDARVMAWWDYGYQIAGIANRTTIADGNTWNHEHIATLGRILSASEDKAHRIARHLADYVLVWAGGGGDDLAKSPHMARIGNSVYHDICPEPTCSQFGFYQGGVPTPMMAECLLYKMVNYGQPGVDLNPKKFTHAYTSKYGKVRIFKVRNVSRKSKEWVADPANRICDAPGSWYCTGQYPPALWPLIAKRKPFQQLEDFNSVKDETSRKYVEDYHKGMDRHKAGGRDAESDLDYATSLDSMGFKYVGCYGAESALGADKVYAGGEKGAQFGLALQFAAQKNKKYLAIASRGVDGHVFAFNEKPRKSKKFDDEGCDVPCADVDAYRCGCADEMCDDLPAAPGETNRRRWVVYEIPMETLQMLQAQNQKKPGRRSSKRSGSRRP